MFDRCADGGSYGFFIRHPNILSDVFTKHSEVTKVDYCGRTVIFEKPSQFIIIREASGDQAESVMSKLLLLSVLSIVVNMEAFGQIAFEKGYFIDESHQRIECLIKNLDWRNNPSEFEYKMPDDDRILKASVETVREFGVDNVSKWIRATVNIDESSDEFSKINHERNPIFKEKRLFLKVLIEGKASLFLYRQGNLTRFFHRKDDAEITQLVYKRYWVGTNVAYNNSFRQQLASALTCQSMEPDEAGKLKYAARDLERYFVRYNECSGSGSTSYETRVKRDVLNLTVTAGLNYSSLSIVNERSDWKNFDLDGEPGLRVGLGLEFILPFNKHKWSLFVDPAFQYYKSAKTQEAASVSSGQLTAKVNYTSAEVALGARHYFFLNDRSKIFADVSYVVDFSRGSKIEFLRTNDNSIFEEVDPGGGKNLGFGLGYKFMDKLSIGIRYQTSRDILVSYPQWNSTYKTTSIMVGYSLF